LNATPGITLESFDWTDDTLRPAGSVTITLDAVLIPFDGNYRAAMQRIQHFMQTLRGVPSLHDVRLLSSPVNADSSSTLTGKTLNSQSATDPVARFSVELIYREATP
jgi:hypothetical protein